LSWEGKRFESPRMQVATGRYCSLEGRENIIRNRGTLANILQSKGSFTYTLYIHTHARTRAHTHTHTHTYIL